MLNFTENHKKLIKNSQLKVLKFSQLAPEVKLDDTSSEEGATPIHEYEATVIFDKHRRTFVGNSSQISSFSARSRLSAKISKAQIIPSNVIDTGGQLLQI